MQKTIMRPKDFGHFKPSYTFINCDVLEQTGTQHKGPPRAKIWAYVTNGSSKELAIEYEGKNLDKAIEGAMKEMFPDVVAEQVSIDFLTTQKRDFGNSYQIECRVRNKNRDAIVEVKKNYDSRVGGTFQTVMQSYDMMRQYICEQEEKNIPLHDIH